jgi:hypothetical protein
MPEQPNGKADKWKYLVAGLISVLFVILFLLAHFRIQATLIDDAFITYRHSANLAAGNGLVYNAGERVLGATTVAYAVLLGAVATITGIASLPIVSQIISAVLLLVAGGSAALTGKKITGQPLAGSAILGIILLGPHTLFSSLAAMESPLFLAVISLALMAHINERWLIWALLVGLMPLIRPEGVFVVGLSLLMLGREWAKEVSPRLRIQAKHVPMISAMFGPGAIWAVVGYLYYGSPVPQSIVGKRAGYYPLSVAESASAVIEGMSHSLAPGLLESAPRWPSLWLVLGTYVVGMIVIGLGAVWFARRYPSLWIVPGLAVILLLFYATSRTLLFGHYYAHFETVVKICWWAGLYAISEELIAKRFRRKRLHDYVSVSIALLVLAPSLILYPISSVWSGKPEQENGVFFEQAVERQPEYHRLALDINPYVPEGTVVYMAEIGELGFYMDQVKIVDPGGLVSPETVPYLPVPDEQRPRVSVGVIPPRQVRDQRPDMLIFLEIFGRYGILDDPWFWDNYTAVVVRKGDWLPWDSEALYVFARNDFEPGLMLQTLDLSEE